MPPLDQLLQPIIDAFTSILNSAVASWVEVAIPMLIQMITDAFYAFISGFFPAAA
jgi:hypothetical protein